MVNIHDIQLGNLYLYNGSIFRADSINRLQDGLDAILYEKQLKEDGSFRYTSAYASELEPLPITTELLEKFFGEPAYTDGYQVGDVNCFVEDMIMDTGCVMVELGFNDIKPVQYVHDMQNLIYELTKIKIVCQK